MTRTLVIANQNKLIVDIPDDYIGRRIEITCIALNELEGEKANTSKENFRGKLKMTDQQQKDFDLYLNQIKAEWNKEF
jgi:hypothetical protein